MRIQNTIALWKMIKKMGRFSDSSYDKTIVDKLKTALSIHGNFENGLNSISIEDFLEALFSAISPFITMYQDILTLYQKCTATQADQNIEFEIKPAALHRLRLDLSHFLQKSDMQ